MVCVAQVGAAHGVRGAFRLRCFTEAPENVAAYGPLCDERGQQLFELRILGAGQGRRDRGRADGITDRDAAEALRGAAPLRAARRACPPRTRTSSTTRTWWGWPPATPSGARSAR